jgi:hypothetical protein
LISLQAGYGDTRPLVSRGCRRLVKSWVLLRDESRTISGRRARDSFVPLGPRDSSTFTHSSRRRLHSYAAPRLDVRGSLGRREKCLVLTRTPQGLKPYHSQQLREPERPALPRLRKGCGLGPRLGVAQRVPDWAEVSGGVSRYRVREDSVATHRTRSRTGETPAPT